MPNHAPAMPDILSVEHVDDPLRTFRSLREDYPVVFHEQSDTWLISRYEDVRAVLSDNARFTTDMYKRTVSPVFGPEPTFVEMGGKEHTAHRSLVSPFLHGAGLERFTSVIDARAKSLLDPLFARERAKVATGEADRAQIDLVEEFSAIYPIDIIADMMALPDRDYDRFARWYHGIIGFIGNLGGDEGIRAAGLAASEEWGEYILPLISERRASGEGEDLISILGRSEVDGLSMTDQQIRGVLTAMLVAGSETTDHQIAAVFHCLIEHPDQFEEVRADRTLLDAAMAETMRYASIQQIIQRYAVADVEIRGVTIPEGSTVSLVLAAANRDPERWARPDEFDIHRADHNVARAFTGAAEHVGFGGGRHYCVGAQLSKREVELAVGRLFDEMTDIELAPGFEPRFEGSFIRFLPSLPLTYVPD